MKRVPELAALGSMAAGKHRGCRGRETPGRKAAGCGSGSADAAPALLIPAGRSRCAQLCTPLEDVELSSSHSWTVSFLWTRTQSGEGGRQSSRDRSRCSDSENPNCELQDEGAHDLAERLVSPSVRWDGNSHPPQRSVKTASVRLRALCPPHGRDSQASLGTLTRAAFPSGCASVWEVKGVLVPSSPRSAGPFSSGLSWYSPRLSSLGSCPLL